MRQRLTPLPTLCPVTLDDLLVIVPWVLPALVPLLKPVLTDRSGSNSLEFGPISNSCLDVVDLET